jgi:hypothetical protein
MTAIRALLAAAVAAPLLAACANGTSSEYIEAQEPKRIHSNASVGDLVLCYKAKLGEDANIFAYPEGGKVDIRVGYAQAADTRYFYVVALRQAAQGSNVEVRSAGEWRLMMSQSKLVGIAEDCKPGTAR